ncbi:MAG: GYF domain-containing protein [Pirellula sp.]
MGIRFHCHMCNHALHVKDFLAGKRGKCPNCNGSFRIPQGGDGYSLSIDELAKSDSAIVSAVRPKTPSAAKPTNPAPKTTPSSASPAIEATQPKTDQDPLAKKATTQSESASRDRSKKATSSEKLDKTTKSVAQPTAVAPSPSSPAGHRALPASIASLQNVQWYVRPPSGGQFGPADTAILATWIDENRITADSYLWREGMEQWQLASELLPEAFPTTALSAKAPTPPAASAAPASAAEDDLLQATGPSSLALNKASAAIKRRRQQTRQWLILGVLVAIAIALTGVLFYILYFKK